MIPEPLRRVFGKREYKVSRGTRDPSVARGHGRASGDLRFISSGKSKTSLSSLPFSLVRRTSLPTFARSLVEPEQLSKGLRKQYDC